MEVIDSYIKLITQTYLVKVITWSYDRDKGWNPLIIRFEDDQLKNFLKNFGGNGYRHGVKYKVKINGDVEFISVAGQLIEDILEVINSKKPQ